MSTDSVTGSVDFATNLPTESITTISTGIAETTEYITENGITTVDSITESVLNISSPINSAPPVTLFEAFIVIEIVMTTLELIISVVAAIKIPRWRRNYRNQMLMQLSVARFIKRFIFLIKFLQQNPSNTSTQQLDTILNCCQIYIDFVIVILVFFFIKHMYDSLIIVLVKISKNKLLKVLAWSWVLPIPISASFTAVIMTNLLKEKFVTLIICCIFRWPLIFLGTALYITVLYRVMTDKIRRFARSLTTVTFLLCLVINFYFFSKDIIYLWCLDSFTVTLISYISGFLMNCLILCFYVVLITLSFSHNTHSSKSVPDHSIAIDNNEKTDCHQVINEI